MSQENVDLVRERYQQVNERGFAAIADILAPEFKMDSPQGVESSQAHDKAGLQKWFEKMDEVWEKTHLRSYPQSALDAER